MAPFRAMKASQLGWSPKVWDKGTHGLIPSAAGLQSLMQPALGFESWLIISLGLDKEHLTFCFHVRVYKCVCVHMCTYVYVWCVCAVCGCTVSQFPFIKKPFVLTGANCNASLPLLTWWRPSCLTRSQAEVKAVRAPPICGRRHSSTHVLIPQ